MIDLSAIDYRALHLAPRARRTDPPTSHAAAINARTGKAQALRERILAALQDGPMTAREIAAKLGEDYISVQRRMSEVRGIWRTPQERDGCRVWAAMESRYFHEMGGMA